jgi:hypothetical protein
MEAVIAIAAALMLIVLLDASFQIAFCLLRWAPSLALGSFVGWFAHHHGVKALEATALFALTALAAKRVLLAIVSRNQNH